MSIVGSVLLMTALPLSAHFCQTYLVVNMANDSKAKPTWLNTAMPTIAIAQPGQAVSTEAGSAPLAEGSEAPLLGDTIQFKVQNNPQPFGGQGDTDWSSIKFNKEEAAE